MDPRDRRAVIRVRDATKLEGQLAMSDGDGVEVPITREGLQEADVRQESASEALTPGGDAQAGGPGIGLERLRSGLRPLRKLLTSRTPNDRGRTRRRHGGLSPPGVHGAPEEKPRQQDHSNHGPSMSPLRAQAKA